MTQTLLIELLTEELPPKALAKLGEAFADRIYHRLVELDFVETDDSAQPGLAQPWEWYATPRRLAVLIRGVRSMSPDKQVREKVLPVAVALDAEGKPSAPLAKKLAALAATAKVDTITLAQLERAVDGKAESFFYTYTAAGSQLAHGVQAALEESIAKLPIPKVMSYQRPDGATVQFVRPVHKLLALHGSEVLPLAILGLAADRVTLGHRFLSQGELAIDHAENYAALLDTKGKVIASVPARKEKIRAALLDKAGKDQTLMPEALLDEVTALVEWPVVYECNFEQEFLAVPQECLILTMQTNQKYFALTDHGGKLRSRFLIVSNLETADPQHIIGGNERVVRPRLSDAKFFFEQDKKKKLADRLPGLANVVYHNKLGTQAERTQRVKTLAGKIAQAIGGDVALAERGALLAKTDLLTDMVGEFPELQGIMGTYYAKHDGEPDEVAQAISEHYQPRFAGDALPATQAGTAVALADKLETLVGIWGIGLQPTGDKDPFALRRHALGILRMLIEKRLPLSIMTLLSDAAHLFAGNVNFKDPSADLQAFIYDRLRGLLREREYTQNEVESVVSQNPDILNNVIERLNAVKTFVSLPESEALAAANKRIRNILKKAPLIDANAMEHRKWESAEEATLFNTLNTLGPIIVSHFGAQSYKEALLELAKFKQPVDAFFDKVMVMADDPALRNSRLALLQSLDGLMNQVADISKLAA